MPTEARPLTGGCHCADCRRAAGAPMVAWFSVAPEDFRVVAGEMRRYASSARAERGFCGDCGTALTYAAHDSPGEIDVTTASLDDPALMPPEDHVQFGSHLPWVVPGDGLPRFRGSRAEGQREE